MSKHPSSINIRTVIVGFMLQFALAVFVMRTSFGYYLFKFLGDEVEKFLAFTDEGSKLVFGSTYLDHFFVFKVIDLNSLIHSI